MKSSLARLDLRLDAADKARITRAADLRGVPVSAFVRDAVLREAERVMANRAHGHVVGSGVEALRGAFDAPFRPNAKLKLKKALARVTAQG